MKIIKEFCPDKTKFKSEAHRLAFETLILYHINIKNHSRFSTFTDKSRELQSIVFIEYFCLNKTLSEIARILGKSRSYIRQIKFRLLYTFRSMIFDYVD